MNYYAVVKKVCFTLAIVIFIAGYLSLAFDQFVPYVPPVPPQVHSKSPTVYTWRIPEPVVEEIIRSYTKKKVELEQAVDAEIKVQQNMNIPFEQRLSEEDMKKEYFIYSISALFDPSASMDSTSYIIGPNHELEEKYINSFTARVFIGWSERADDKIGACIRHWKETQVRPFNVVLVDDISREFNF